MRIKRYVADDMKSAVNMVKADFGEEAVILHTKRFKRGGLFGLFGRPKVEILAAIEPGTRPNTRRERELRRAQETTAAALEALQHEVRSLREVVGAPTAAAASAPHGLQAAWERLVSQEIRDEDVQGLLDDVARDATPGELEDASWVWHRLVEHIGEQIMTTPPWQFERTPVIVPLVGPTGVGKT